MQYPVFIIFAYYFGLILIDLAGKSAFIGIIEGGVSGSAAGYLLTGFTKLVLIPTMQGIIFGSAVGIIIGFLARYLADTEKFKNVKRKSWQFVRIA